MGIQLIFLLIKLHLITSGLLVHESTAKANYLHHSGSHSSIAFPPSKSLSRGPAESVVILPSKSSSGAPLKRWVHGSAASAPISYHKHHHSRRKFNNPALEPAYLIPPAYIHQGPSVSQGQPPLSSVSWGFPAPAPSPAVPSTHSNIPLHSPTISPLGSSLKKIKAPPPPPVLALPPPPPNQDCMWVTCTAPFTYTPAGSSCGCVRPVQVKLRISIAIYNFFPLVSELAEEIAASVLLNQSQVRIMGANEASQQLEKTTVLINLVPKGTKFDDTTAFLIYKRFWQREILIEPLQFGAYEVLYVQYPGLPPSPPSAPSSLSTTDGGPGTGNNGGLMKPLGVAVPRRNKKGLSGSMITIIVLSSFSVCVISIGVAWLFLLQYGCYGRQPEEMPHSSISVSSKPSGVARPLIAGSMRGSASMSFNSGILTYTGSAKTFTLNDIEKATNNFDASRVLGEGGFGLVYSAILEDGRNVAVKTLKRCDQHGGREFLAEVEMLSRLHHKNLVKLIGICIDNHTRCLVYELVPNGSVESHLHGSDKETDPLDWDARMKIALGAARGLAYLHEDSNPRVIHRDFKSSNILLEYNFTPKVSDFGLARAAIDEGNKHISTHVMGTFGYLAPEYAMTGHLLVKSDVYSYGVVLLELLTGRKPVDFSQPPGQENLVAWARPLLTSNEGLETIIDPFVKSHISSDTVAKAAAIASMCVQPEVSHRPFMGEVVQALKLVCNEFDEMKDLRSSGCSSRGFLE